MTDKQNPPSTPDGDHFLAAGLRGFKVLAFVWVLPLLILAAINAQALWICSGEMSPVEQAWGWSFAGATILNLLLGVGHVLFLARAHRPLSSLGALVPALVQVGFIVFTSLTFDHFIPATVQEWMLPPQRLLLHQWTFAMVPAFYATAVAAGFRSRRNIASDVGVTFLVTIAGPFLLWAVVVVLSHGILGILNVHGSAIILALLTAAATLLFGAGLLRLMLITWESVLSRTPSWRMVGSILFALVLPLSGLLLNTLIPFPVDFQHPLIYVGVVLNAAILLVNPQSPGGKPVVLWMLRWVSLPFTLYFFLVFLPFLPLSILAMLAIGSGFLILAPTFLLIHHLQRIGHSWRALNLRPAVSVPLAFLSFWVLPVLMVGQSYWMKFQLNRGIDYVLSPDLREFQSFGPGSGMVKQSLRWLEEIKSGVYYPILTNLRSQILFNRLVLPDSKSDRLNLAFAGKLPREDETDGWGFLSFFGAQGSVRGVLAAPSAEPLPAATLASVTTSRMNRADGTQVTRLKLEMEGGPEGQSEFKTRIELPEGAWISGFALYIEEERVEGRLFEEKSALWVYRMIRDAERSARLRDPATLTCEADGTLRLQVFPLDPGQRRCCEVDVMCFGQGGIVKIGETAVALPSDISFPRSPAVESEGRLGVLQEGHENQAFVREPYLHLLIDRSAKGLTEAQILARMEQLRANYPEVQRLRLTLVNLEARELGIGWMDWDQAGAALLGALPQLDCEGGCLMGPAIARAAFSALRSPHLDEWLMRPVFVVLGGEPVPSPEPALNNRVRRPVRTRTPSSDLLDYDRDLWAPFKHLLPDVADPLVIRGDATLPEVPLTAVPINLYRAGSGFAIGRADGVGWLRFEGSDASVSMTRYQPTDASWQPIDLQFDLPPPVRAAAALDLAAFASQLNPAQWNLDLPKIVAMSKALNLLTPATAFIVVENSAQWKMLELKEAQKLGAPAVLEFDETPEPSVLFLAALFAAFLLLQRFRTKNLRIGGR